MRLESREEFIAAVSRTTRKHDKSQQSIQHQDSLNVQDDLNDEIRRLDRNRSDDLKFRCNRYWKWECGRRRIWFAIHIRHCVFSATTELIPNWLSRVFDIGFWVLHGACWLLLAAWSHSALNLPLLGRKPIPALLVGLLLVYGFWILLWAIGRAINCFLTQIETIWIWFAGKQGVTLRREHDWVRSLGREYYFTPSYNSFGDK
jgi:hypothetical protein